MSWKLDNDRPIYVQLLEQLIIRIVSGVYKPGDRLPAVRELAAEAAVNPNTMQRALAELEAMGLVVTQRTAGRTITTDVQVIEAQRKSLASGQVKMYTEAMSRLGYNKNTAAQFILELEE